MRHEHRVCYSHHCHGKHTMHTGKIVKIKRRKYSQWRCNECGMTKYF
jgi:hypothetical protein